jgi:hypothetical protein
MSSCPIPTGHVTFSALAKDGLSCYVVCHQLIRGNMMRKRIINQRAKELTQTDQGWLDLERLERVDITKEDTENLIDSALTPSAEPGWRASQPGEQTVRLLFDEPQRMFVSQVARDTSGLCRSPKIHRP